MQYPAPYSRKTIFLLSARDRRPLADFFKPHWARQERVEGNHMSSRQIGVLEALPLSIIGTGWFDKKQSRTELGFNKCMAYFSIYVYTYIYIYIHTYVYTQNMNDLYLDHQRPRIFFHIKAGVTQVLGIYIYIFISYAYLCALLLSQGSCTDCLIPYDRKHQKKTLRENIVHWSASCWPE